MIQDQICKIKAKLENKRVASRRFIIAIAGPPGAGKTTLSKALVKDLARSLPAHYVPMDGFHLDNATLNEMGMLDRKGAPQTFDAAGIVTAVKRLHQKQETVSLPAFDRAKDMSIPDAISIPAALDVIVIEGNYLLLNYAPWNTLAPMFGLTICLSPSMDILRGRLVQRWLDHGMTAAGAEARAAGNDIPNAQHVLDHSLQADIVFR